MFCVVLQWIFFILAGNKDNYNISDEFEFRPDPTSDCGVFEKSIFCIVAALAPSILNFDRIFFILRSNKDNHNILDKIRPRTAKLATLECLKNQFLVLGPLKRLQF